MMEVVSKVLDNTRFFSNKSRNMDQSRYIGVDVGAYELVCAYPSKVDEQRFEYKKFSNDEEGIAKFMRTMDHAIDHVIAEFTRVYSSLLVWRLSEAKLKVSVITSKQSQAYRVSIKNESIKNDYRDAYHLSGYGKLHTPDIYVPKPAEVQMSIQLQRLYNQLVMRRKAIKQQLDCLRREPVINEKVEARLVKLLEIHDEHIEDTKAEMTSFDEEEFNQTVELIESVPGVGPVTASAMTIMTKGLKDFTTDNKVAKYVGVNPTQNDSGTKKGRQSIQRRGNKRLRSLLYNCAVSAKRWNPQSKELYNRLRAKGKCHKVAMIVVVRQLIRFIFAVVKSGKPYDKEYKPEPRVA
jgi:transposase